MSKFRIKFWQIFALISGTIVACVMALASVSYNATLGTAEPAFDWLPISNTSVFASLALAFDFGLIASVFGFWHWRQVNRVATIFCAILFGISSLFSIHSVRGYIALNITKTLAPAARDHDLYQSVRQELAGAQAHLAALRESLLKTKSRRRRNRLAQDIEDQLRLVHKTRARLSSTKITSQVAPLKGLEWFLAITLWFFNATCWTAWFGSNGRLPAEGRPPSNGRLPTEPRDVGRPSSEHELGALDRAHSDGNVSLWLANYHQTKPEHCAALYDRYRAWCHQHNLVPLADRKFYAQLVELGARKYRDGRNGPMLYALPQLRETSDTRPLRQIEQEGARSWA